MLPLAFWCRGHPKFCEYVGKSSCMNPIEYKSLDSCSEEYNIQFSRYVGLPNNFFLIWKAAQLRSRVFTKATRYLTLPFCSNFYPLLVFSVVWSSILSALYSVFLAFRHNPTFRHSNSTQCRNCWVSLIFSDRSEGDVICKIRIRQHDMAHTRLIVLEEL